MLLDNGHLRLKLRSPLYKRVELRARQRLAAPPCADREAAYARQHGGARLRPHVATEFNSRKKGKKEIGRVGKGVHVGAGGDKGGAQGKREPKREKGGERERERGRKFSFYLSSYSLFCSTSLILLMCWRLAEACLRRISVFSTRVPSVRRAVRPPPCWSREWLATKQTPKWAQKTYIERGRPYLYM